ncbi:MAG: hypothetical protein ACXWHB_06010, partial [Usitatibacter sp.]
MKRYFAAAILALPFTTAFAAAERPQDRWSLSDLYAGTQAWNADVAKTEEDLKRFAACGGHLGDSAKRFKECLDLEYDIAKRYYRLGVYAGEREAENRDDRKKVVDAFFGEWKAFEATIGTTLYGAMKEDTVYTKVRKYPDT